MKKHLLSVMIGSFLFFLAGYQPAMAQEGKSSKVHITITENDQVTTDTTFELAEGQDPEMIKRMVTHMAGGDIHAKHMSQDIHVSHSGDKKMVWVSSDDDVDMDFEYSHMMSDINMDSIKEAHPDAKVLVVKNKDGEITVKEVDDEHEMHMGEDEHGGHHKMMFIEEGEDGETVHVHNSKSGKKIMMISEEQGDDSKEHTVIIHTDGDCQGKEKKIEVIIHGDEDIEWVEKGDGDENIEVYVIKDGDENVKVIKRKVIVEIDDEDPVEVEVEVDIEEEKAGKKKKKKK